MKFKSSPGRAVVELWLGLGKASAKLESSLGNRLVGPWCCPTVNSRTPKRKSDRPHTWLQQSSAVAFLGVAEQHLQCQGGALAMAWHVIGPCRLEWPRGRLTCQAIERLRLKLMASAPAKTRTTSVEWSQLVATHTHTSTYFLLQDPGVTALLGAPGQRPSAGPCRAGWLSYAVVCFAHFSKTTTCDTDSHVAGLPSASYRSDAACRCLT